MSPTPQPDDPCSQSSGPSTHPPSPLSGEEPGVPSLGVTQRLIEKCVNTLTAVKLARDKVVLSESKQDVEESGAEYETDLEEEDDGKTAYVCLEIPKMVDWG